MQTEQYPDLETFCQTESYKNWLSQWSPRDNTKVDRWFDHVGKFDYYTARQREASRSSTRLPFYLIDSIEVKDLDCVDIGCGPNFFKSFYKNIGIEIDQIIFEDQSRNTYENIIYSKKIANPKINENWLLITSASHMKRALLIADKNNWDLIPYAVDFKNIKEFI